MNHDQAKNLYLSLDDDQKVDLLARTAGYLTICFRDIAYTQAPAPENLLKLQGINELQHQLLSQLQKHFHHDDARYPDDIFFAGLLERARHHGILPFLQQSLTHSLSAWPTS